MRRFIVLLAVVFISWALITNKISIKDPQAAIQNVKSELLALKENPDFTDTIESLSYQFKNLAAQLSQSREHLSTEQEKLLPKLEKPALSAPAKHVFSVYNIEIGDSREKAEQQLGSPKRSSTNEYGIKWYTYHKNYQHFIMAAYDKDNKVAGLYSNQDLISSTNGIKLGTPKDDVLKTLGSPLSKIQKGLMFYLLPKDRDYDLFLLGDSYATIFYDKHEQNTVTSIQLISKDVERNKNAYYTKPSERLSSGFAYQLFDLTNASRVQHRLHPLTWDNRIKGTAQKHSADMAAHNFFDHTNLQGQSPFDRMQSDDIRYRVAGENIAYGQLSSIFAHEGLMNSLGHRENILKPDFERLGVGVAFNTNSQPYYTENFYTK